MMRPINKTKHINIFYQWQEVRPLAENKSKMYLINQQQYTFCIIIDINYDVTTQTPQIKSNHVGPSSHPLPCQFTQILHPVCYFLFLRLANFIALVYLVQLNPKSFHLYFFTHSIPITSMCRLLGYVGGIVLFLVLGIKKISGYQFFFATAILNLIAIFLIIVFRLLAKKLNGFWKIWWKRLQKQICLAMACLSQYTELPEYEITTTTIDGLGNKSVLTSTTNNTIIWGCVECVVCAVLSCVSPVIVTFILFCYVQAIYYECRFRDQMKVKKDKKQEEIARNSARMSLESPLYRTASGNKDTERTNSSGINNSNSPNYNSNIPMNPNYNMNVGLNTNMNMYSNNIYMQPAYIKKTVTKTIYVGNPADLPQMEHMEQISIMQNDTNQQEQKQPQNQTISNNQNKYAQNQLKFDEQPIIQQRFVNDQL